MILAISFQQTLITALFQSHHLSSDQRPECPKGILQTARVPKTESVTLPVWEPLRPSVPPANPLLKLSILHKDF